MHLVTLVLCASALAACASKKAADQPPADDPTLEEMENTPQDTSWQSKVFQIMDCDMYIAGMTNCRDAIPEAARGAFDQGMKNTIASIEQVPEDHRETTCEQMLAASVDALKELCPTAFSSMEEEQ